MGGSPEDVAIRPAAYRLPPPEQLPETSRIDEMCSVPAPLAFDIEPLPVVPDVLPVPVVEPVPVVLPVPAVEPVPLVDPPPYADDDEDDDEFSTVPRTSTRWLTYFCRSLLSLPVRR